MASSVTQQVDWRQMLKAGSFDLGMRNSQYARRSRRTTGLPTEYEQARQPVIKIARAQKQKKTYSPCPCAALRPFVRRFLRQPTVNKLCALLSTLLCIPPTTIPIFGPPKIADSRRVVLESCPCFPHFRCLPRKTLSFPQPQQPDACVFLVSRRNSSTI